MIYYDKSLHGRKIPSSIFTQLTYQKVLRGIHGKYNRYLVAADEASHDILVNLPYRVYYFGDAEGAASSNTLILGSDENTGETKYGLWLGWCGNILSMNTPPILTSMWAKVGTKPWKLSDFEQALRAGFTSEYYPAEDFFNFQGYMNFCRVLGDYACMEVFRSILVDSEMPFDVEAYNKEVDRMDLPYVDEISLRMTLSSIVEDIRDTLTSEGLLGDEDSAPTKI